MQPLTRRPDTTTPPTSAATPDLARWLSLGAVAGPVLFTLAWLVLGFLSPGYPLWDMEIEPYSPISQPVSGLGLGVTAPYMNAAFVLSGLLILAGSVGIFHSIGELSRRARWTGAVLLGLHGLGAVMDGIFTLESFFLHFVGFLLALSTIVSFPVVGRLFRRVPRWRRLGGWLLLAGPLTLVLAVAYFASFDPVVAGSGIGVGGLIQRILIAEIQVWIVAMGWWAYRASDPT